MEVRLKQSEERTIQELVDLVSVPTSPTPACGVVYVLARREVDRASCQQRESRGQERGRAERGDKSFPQGLPHLLRKKERVI